MRKWCALFWLALSFASVLSATSLRQEILLERAPAARVLEILRARFPDLEFIPHPVLNGFYALGKRTDIVKMKAAIPELDLPLGQIILGCKLLQRTNLPVDWRSNWQGRIRESGETVPLRCGQLQLAPANRAFLIASSESHVLASPRVALQSGHSAQIHIGDKYLTGGTYQDVGLSLTSIITIQEDNLNCCLAGEFVVPDGSTGRTRTLTFDKHVELKNHETLVLEGLLSPEEARAAVTAVPLLARLPVLGDLFRHSPNQESLWVMVTPELMK
jgi:hypothetical protein